MLNRAVGTISCRKLCFAATDFLHQGRKVSKGLHLLLFAFFAAFCQIWFRLRRVGLYIHSPVTNPSFSSLLSRSFNSLGKKVHLVAQIVPAGRTKGSAGKQGQLEASK
jgi:hypothetical protein